MSVWCRYVLFSFCSDSLLRAELPSLSTDTKALLTAQTVRDGEMTSEINIWAHDITTNTRVSLLQLFLIQLMVGLIQQVCHLVTSLDSSVSRSCDSLRRSVFFLTVDGSDYSKLHETLSGKISLSLMVKSGVMRGVILLLDHIYLFVYLFLCDRTWISPGWWSVCLNSL